jgi:hypothetical protein
LKKIFVGNLDFNVTEESALLNLRAVWNRGKCPKLSINGLTAISGLKNDRDLGQIQAVQPRVATEVCRQAVNVPQLRINPMGPRSSVPRETGKTRRYLNKTS